MRLLVFPLCFLISFLYAQKETSHWYYSSYLNFREVETDFNSKPPTTTLIRPTRNTETNYTSISDTAGELLFYTEGSTVYNRNNAVMDNGGGLGRDPFLYPQNTLASPWPENDSLYYIFSIDEGNFDLELAIVNMRANAGLGRVISKNLRVQDSSSIIAATFHQNQRDIWLITHDMNNDTFKIYAITSAGLSTSPLSQNIGSIDHSRLNTEGMYMKVSHDGKHLALASFTSLEIYEFDNRTGRLSNPILITRAPSGGSDYYFFGMEFSPNNRFLYVPSSLSRIYSIYAGRNSDILRYDLEASDLKASQEIVASNVPRMTDLLLASDQYIYGLILDYRHLSRITNPNVLKDIGLVESAIDLGGLSGSFALPNFVRGYIPTINFSSLCPNKAITFETNSYHSINKVVWDFGDGTPKIDQITPTHTYTKGGLYDLSVEYTYNDGRTYTLNQTIEIDTAITFLLPPNTCLNNPPIPLNRVTPVGGTYKGQGVDPKTNTFNPLDAGTGTFPITYVYTTKYGCTDSATQNITVGAPQIFTLALKQDTFCLNSPTLNLDYISPAGGKYIGKGVTANRFSPATAGLGTHLYHLFSQMMLCKSTQNL